MGDPFLRLVYLTLPSQTEPTLNISFDDGRHFRFRITREQLYQLNAQTADALLRGVVRPWPPEQPSLFDRPADPQEQQLSLDMSS